MTRLDIIRVAREFGWSQKDIDGLLCIVETVAEAEREACAKIVLDNSDAEGICCTDDVLEAFRQRGEKNGG